MKSCDDECANSSDDGHAVRDDECGAASNDVTADECCADDDDDDDDDDAMDDACAAFESDDEAMSEPDEMAECDDVLTVCDDKPMSACNDELILAFICDEALMSARDGKFTDDEYGVFDDESRLIMGG